MGSKFKSDAAATANDLFFRVNKRRVKMDSAQFKTCGNEMISYIVDYLDTVQQRRVTPDVQPGYLRELLPASAPQEPESFDAVMKDVEDKIMVGMTHWQHPRFHAYFSSGNSYPSILADMLSDAIGCIGFSWAAGPSCWTGWGRCWDCQAAFSPVLKEALVEV